MYGIYDKTQQLIVVRDTFEQCESVLDWVHKRFYIDIDEYDILPVDEEEAGNCIA